MTPQQIEYVLTVAEERSFSKAAKKLFVTQPSLSKFIINLETSLGVSLFDRSSSPITVTEAGEIFIETAIRIKELEKEMTLRISELSSMKNGTLRIGTTHFYAANMLLKTVIYFHKKYPDIHIAINEDSYGNLEEAVIKGDLDIMIGTGNVDEEFFNIEELCTEKLYLAVPADRTVNKKYKEFALSADDIKENSEKLFTGEYVNLQVFKKEKFILQNSRDGSLNAVKKYCKSISFSPEVAFKSENLETIFSFVKAGLGVAFIPDTFIKFSDTSEHPLYYALGSSELESHIKLMYKKNKYLPRAAVEFSNSLRELIGMGTWK